MSELGERRLGTAHGLAEALAIAPVVSVGFASYLVAGHAGGATPAAMVIAFAGTLALGWVFAQFARRYAGAGTVYEYLALAGPRLPGMIAAGAYFLIALLAASGGLVTGLLLQSACTAQLGFDPGWWTGGVAALAVIGVLLYLGIRLSTRSVLLLSGLATVPFLVLSAVILVRGGARGLTLAPFDPTRGHVVQGLLYAVLMFAGFESAACLGEESSRPHHSIPRAMLAAIVLCGVFYIVVLYSVTIGFGIDRARQVWGSDPLAVIGLGDRWAGAPLSSLLELATIVDLLAFLIAVMNVAARGYFTLARDGLLPTPLARVSKRGTPVGGVALIVGANLAVMVVAVPFRNRFDVFSATASAGPLISLCVYLALCLLVTRLIARSPGPWWRWPLAAAGAVVPILGLYGSLVPFPHGPRLGGLLLALISVLGAGAWVGWLQVRRRDAVSNAAAHAFVPTVGEENSARPSC